MKLKLTDGAAGANMAFAIKLFMAITAFVGLAMGFSDALLANYFKDAYDVNAQQRGFIEFPREMPGVLAIFVIAALAGLRDIRTALAAHALTAAALIALAFLRPAFPVMLIFLFLYSMGVHMYLALGDSIALSLAQKQNMGSMLGRINSVRMALFMFAGVVTFFGFRRGLFDFETPVAVFLLAAVCLTLACLLFLLLTRIAPAGENGPARRSTKLVFRRAYLRYYVICALFGGRKQIMLVYSPWVLIDLLDFGADTMSILSVAGAFIGIFFMPLVGRWIDRFGVRNVMMAEAFAFISVYIAYGFLSRWISHNAVVLTGAGMMLVYLLNIIDRMSAQFAMVRAVYLRSIALTPDDVTPSLSLGMSLDHVIGIAFSFVCGTIWYIWGPEYVFLLAGILSLANLFAARGIGIKESFSA
ncbi:MAG: MFS transporter [Gracilibacteraceae bacterium]|jgi:predicted MFS family arabinose efflux permease|nr:MFS transporter [Gracilibacteraceae bacterium]